jgi:hypothetical protein
MPPIWQQKCYDVQSTDEEERVFMTIVRFHLLCTGVLLKLDLPNGDTSGAWKLAEEISKSVPDWPGALRVEQVSEVDGRVKIRFTCQEQWRGEVTAQCNLNHTFYIQDRGQFSVLNEVYELLRTLECIVFPSILIMKEVILSLNFNHFQ